MKKIIRNITPPIIYKLMKSLVNIFKKKDELFNGENELFIDSIEQARVYGEYGLGFSTLYAVNEKNKKTISVDTNKEWIEIIESKLSKERSKFNFKWVDLGPIIGNWGFPKDYSKKENIQTYLDSIWTDKEKPDVVLIDGRFRIGAFLNSYIHSEPDTLIIFDDYPSRPIYHIVEELIKPLKKNNRQVLFKIPVDKDLAKAKDLLNDFRFVMK